MSASQLQRLAASISSSRRSDELQNLRRIADPENTNMADGMGTPYEKEFIASAKKIDHITVQYLPITPLTVTIPATDIDDNNDYKYENLDTPFEKWEVKPLQHMTMVTSSSRGLAFVRGDWQDEVNALSPAGSGSGDHSIRSGTATPRSERDPNKPRVKVSFADYQAGKRPTSSSSKATGMGGNGSQNGGTTSSGSKDAPNDDTQKMIDQIVAKSAAATQASRNLKTKTLKTVSDSLSFLPTPAKTAGPTTPKDLVVKINGNIGSVTKNGDSTTVSNKPKRPLEDAETTPEKRSKIAHKPAPAPAPAAALAPVLKAPAPKKKFEPLFGPRKSPLLQPQLAITKTAVGKTSDHRSPAPSKLSNSTQTDSRASKAKEQTHKKPSADDENGKENSLESMPPLLSPLPAGLISPEKHIAASKKQEITPPKSPSKAVEMTSSNRTKTNIDSTTSSLRAVPPLLSPDLPEWIETELTRQKELPPPVSKSSPLPTAALHGVEARHERSRKPDTPGVARKTTKAKNATVNHSKAEIFKEEEPAPEKLSLVIKLKYGKRNVKTIKDILRLRARPKDTIVVKEHHTTALSSSNSAVKADERKRARPTEDKYESPAKRTKAPERSPPLQVLESLVDGSIATSQTAVAGTTSGPRIKIGRGSGGRKNSVQLASPPTIDIQKSHTALPQPFKSPGFSTPSNAQRSNAVFGTPKKGDAMKSVTMRKVNSSDGMNPRTPQATISTPAVSTPASSDRLKLSASSPAAPPTEEDKSRDAEAKQLASFTEKYEALGKELKYAGDALLKTKNQPNPPPIISEHDRKLGVITFLEAITAFLLSFESIDLMSALKRRPNDGIHWKGMADGLVGFLDRYALRYAELHALLCLLGAVCREQAERHQIQLLTEKPPTPEFAKEILKNSKARAALLTKYAEHHHVHDKVKFVTTVTEARKLAAAVLERFAKENEVRWVCRLEKTQESKG